jgi:hypothetical protein
LSGEGEVYSDKIFRWTQKKTFVGAEGYIFIFPSMRVLLSMIACPPAFTVGRA